MNWSRFPKLKKLSLALDLPMRALDQYLLDPAPGWYDPEGPHPDVDAAEVPQADGYVDELTYLQRLAPPAMIPNMTAPLQDLREFDILLSGHSWKGSERCRWAFWDALPPLSELARMLLSIGGPDCKYTFKAVVIEGSDDLKEWEFQTTVLNLMIEREIGSITGIPCQTEINDPEYLLGDWTNW